MATSPTTAEGRPRQPWLGRSSEPKQAWGVQQPVQQPARKHRKMTGEREWTLADSNGGVTRGYTANQRMSSDVPQRPARGWGSRGRRFKSCQPDRKRPSQRRFRRDPRPPLGLFRGPRTATRFGAGVPGASPEDFLCCGLTASQRSRSAVVGVCTEARVRTPSVRPTVMARMAWRGCQPGPAAFDADARGSAIMALE